MGFFSFRRKFNSSAHSDNEEIERTALEIRVAVMTSVDLWNIIHIFDFEFNQ